ncbi:hypothetical protein EI555_006826 [Monodon monoceros]|uniref:Uncharacterized protein n=1 Tax=Monodon monoceros TaxID=40151 RepID=A0A4U1F5W0_MONMO|nr:hypothetical protein EI555_006826 [Monodon monoceros]
MTNDDKICNKHETNVLSTWTLGRPVAASLLHRSLGAAPLCPGPCRGPAANEGPPLYGCRGCTPGPALRDHRGPRTQPAQSELPLPQPDPECQKAECLLDELEDNGSFG